jgi:hypothetical protein
MSREQRWCDLSKSKKLELLGPALASATSSSPAITACRERR